MRRLVLLAAAAALLLVPAAAPAHSPSHSPFPKLIALPTGWQPEGIAIRARRGRRLDPDRRRCTGNVRTGQGAPLVPPHEGAQRSASRSTTASCGSPAVPTGKAYVYDARTGADVAARGAGADRPRRSSTTSRSAEGGAYFTDSRAAKVCVAAATAGPLRRERRSRATSPRPATPRPPTSTASRRAAGGRWMLVQTDHRQALRASIRGPASRREIDLGGGDVLNGDGCCCAPARCFVVQNRAEPDRRDPALARPDAGTRDADDHRPGSSTCRRRSPPRTSTSTRSTRASARPTRSRRSTTWCACRSARAQAAAARTAARMACTSSVFST